MGDFVLIPENVLVDVLLSCHWDLLPSFCGTLTILKGVLYSGHFLLLDSLRVLGFFVVYLKFGWCYLTLADIYTNGPS